jgi:hypothetical protein
VGCRGGEGLLFGRNYSSGTFVDYVLEAFSGARTMRIEIAALILLFSSVACSAPDRLEMPPISGSPPGWKSFNLTTIPESNCPIIAGEYSEPPFIYRSGKVAGFMPKDNLDLYSSYIPFHLGERREMETNDINLHGDHFWVRQPDATQFFFVYLNDSTGTLVEYHFRSKEGDFECRDGHIEFPYYEIDGMVEGRSVNFQIRNIVIKDEQDALIIQSTRGPLRGAAKMTENPFTTEFFRYPKVDDTRSN